MNRRYLAVVLTVAMLHICLIWAVQFGNSKPRSLATSPIMVVSQAIQLPAPAPAPADVISAPVALTQPTPKTAAAKVPVSTVVPADTGTDRQPAVKEPSTEVTLQAATSSATTLAAPTGAEMASAKPAAQDSVQLPLSDADYLQNPPPPYPSLSHRLNEQGRTTVRVLIGANGQAERAEIAKSSGYKRLDDAAINTVLRWRYVPGKRGGVAEAMWFDVPINWVLKTN